MQRPWMSDVHWFLSFFKKNDLCMYFIYVNAFFIFYQIFSSFTLQLLSPKPPIPYPCPAPQPTHSCFLVLANGFLNAHQKMKSDPIIDGCEPQFGFWELNSGPLDEQPVLLTNEPSLQPHSTSFLRGSRSISLGMAPCRMEWVLPSQ